MVEIGGFVGSSTSDGCFSSDEDFDVVSGFVTGEGVYDIIGGGNSNPSVAFRDNCLAKSLACHHSRNFSAKILVGSNSFNPEPILPIASLGSNRLLIPRFDPGIEDAAFLIASKAWKSA